MRGSLKKTVFQRIEIFKSSININGIKGKKLEIWAFFDFHQPQTVAIQETKMIVPYQLQNCSRNLVHTVCIGKIEPSTVAA